MRNQVGEEHMEENDNSLGEKNIPIWTLIDIQFQVYDVITLIFP